MLDCEHCTLPPSAKYSGVKKCDEFVWGDLKGAVGVLYCNHCPHSAEYNRVKKSDEFVQGNFKGAVGVLDCHHCPLQLNMILMNLRRRKF